MGYSGGVNGRSASMYKFFTSVLSTRPRVTDHNPAARAASAAPGAGSAAGRRAAQAKSGAAHALAVDEGGAVLLVLGARHPQLVLRAHAAQVRLGLG